MANVILLRDRSEDTPDQYEAAFSAAGYHPISIPVLETFHTNIPHLRDIIQKGPKVSGYKGVIITSKRSCDAWKEALQLLSDSAPDYTHTIARWCEIPFYVVGQATASALTGVFGAYEHLGLTSLDVRGQSSGNATALASFILEDPDKPSVLLYLTGDKNRDTLTHVLHGGGISLEPLQTYRTEGSPSFAKNLATAVETSSQGHHYWWIVFFAPSAAAFVFPILRNHFELRTSQSSGTSELLQARVAAIGPTTYSFLHDELHLEVDVTAQKPSPEDIVASITTYEGRSKIPS
ncbi:tetrapyrrole biosynthesis, uroporphyrinogen III synthase [Phlegmacium glaucopus]|nr:tetrapyrrole biosynthesis, uroporphyrinogen III synthase [Phlegmacium glaucopus]